MASKSNVKSEIKPLFDNVLIKPEEAETKTASGIILPDSVKRKTSARNYHGCREWSYNSEGKTVPMTVKAGQKVMYKKWGGNEVKVNGEDWMMVEQKDILAIVG